MSSHRCCIFIIASLAVFDNQLSAFSRYSCLAAIQYESKLNGDDDFPPPLPSYFTHNDMIFNQNEHKGAVPVRGSSIGVNQANQEAYRTFQRFPNLDRTRNGADLFHGSTSASLLAFTENQNKRGQLQATGVLEAAGKVPFGGEIVFGRHGINRTGLSVVWLGNIRSARFYATDSNTSPWNPDIGKQQLEESKKLFEDRDYDEASTKKQMLKNAIEITEARIKEWPNLNAEEKDLIQNPFPVMYGIRVTRSDALTLFSSDISGEIKLNNGTEGDELRVIFVPEEQVTRVREIIKNSQNPHVQVHSMAEALSFANTEQ